MSIPKIQGSGDVQRKMLACAIDVSDNETPKYLVIGYKITSSTLEFNPDVETGTDINGRNFGSVNKFEPSQTFEPHRLTAGELGSLGEKLIHYFRYRQLEKFSQFKCILIYGFLGPEGGPYPADLYDTCTITPSSLGGEMWTEMPFDVTFGGDVQHGSVDKLIDEVTFTPGDIVNVTGVTLNKDTLEMEVSDTETLVATVTPANATNKTVTWESSNTGVATVSSAGLVTAIGDGTATITVTTNDGGFTDTCEVTVSAGSAG
jgi:uncharacterized protein YjdB